jgi:hypothetical protein
LALGSLFLVKLQLRVAREEAAAFEFITAGFHCGIFIDSGGEIGLLIFLRNLDGYVYAVVFNYSEDKGSSG